MAGVKFVADMSPEDLHQAARHVAKETGFAVHASGGLAFEAKKGNFTLSIVAGALVAYCDFKIVVEPYDDDGAELILTRNTPWWTGAIGLSRTKSWAKTLADNIKKEVERSGFQVLKEKEF
ncbi:MAG: hypothetical protein K2X38_07380 [Gemmataceae bacterium]|nr:hypothetical protein [Gemmataceae bacterium]